MRFVSIAVFLVAAVAWGHQVVDHIQVLHSLRAMGAPVTFSNDGAFVLTPICGELITIILAVWLLRTNRHILSLVLSTLSLMVALFFIIISEASRAG